MGVFVATFAASALGYIPPYSVDDPNFPMPKRFFLQVQEKSSLVSCFVCIGTVVGLYPDVKFCSLL